MLTRLFFASLGLLAAAALAGCGSSGGEVRAAQLFQTCSACHGSHGEGNPDIAAPSIAGLEDWYIRATIDKYRSGTRGGHPDDYEGLRMRPMSRSLRTDEDIDLVVNYVAALPSPERVATLDGDATRGKQFYAPCVGCHGQNGEGVQATNGPSLTKVPDWYLANAIHKFRVGIRGSSPGDNTGAVMRGMSMTLPDEQAINDVVAYILTLPQ